MITSSIPNFTSNNFSSYNVLPCRMFLLDGFAPVLMQMCINIKYWLKASNKSFEQFKRECRLQHFILSKTTFHHLSKGTRKVNSYYIGAMITLTSIPGELLLFSDLEALHKSGKYKIEAAPVVKRVKVKK